MVLCHDVDLVRWARGDFDMGEFARSVADSMSKDVKDMITFLIPAMLAIVAILIIALING